MGEFGDKIRSHNARNGYDQSVGREDLARDLRNPRKNENLRQFARNNDISFREYKSELSLVVHSISSRDE